jgi:hypothetical protein
VLITRRDYTLNKLNGSSDLQCLFCPSCGDLHHNETLLKSPVHNLDTTSYSWLFVIDAGDSLSDSSQKQLQLHHQYTSIPTDSYRRRQVGVVSGHHASAYGSLTSFG